MAITYTISPEARLIKAVASGIIHAQDMDDFVDALLADAALERGLRVLYDTRDAVPDIRILQLAEVAGRALRLTDRGVRRIAMVADSKVTHRMSKTFAVLARALGMDIEVFTQPSAAEAWLDYVSGSSDTAETPLPS
jgi:hypothetical protein